MEIRTEGIGKVRVDSLGAGDVLRYKGGTYMVLTPVRVKGLNPGWVPCANLGKGTIRRLPPELEVDSVNGTVNLFPKA